MSRSRFHTWLTAATDPVAPARFTRRAWWIVGAIIILLLLPTLLHPFGADQALFYVIGRKITHGAMLYRDAVDIKPPLIYHLYALAALLFGGGSFSIRIFDLIMQGATCWLMILTIRRTRGGDLAAALAPICYLLLYLAQGYQYTAQSEGYAGIFSMLLLWMLLFRRTTSGFLIAGALCGALFLLKFTFGVILATALAGELLLYRRSLGEYMRHALPLAGGFAAVVLIFVIYLAAGNALHDFGLVSQFTGDYAKIELRSPAQWFKNLVTLPTLHFIDNYSIVLLLATVTGGAFSLRPIWRADDGEAIDFTRLLRLALIAFVLLFITIVIEAKYPPYHFMRLYPFGAILAAAGIVAALRLFMHRGVAERYAWLMALPIMGTLLLFGPFIRYTWHTLLPVKQELNRALATMPPRLEPYSQEAFDAIGMYVRAHTKEGEKLFAMSSQAALIYYHAQVLPEFKVFHSAFVIAPFAPQEWRDSTRAYLLREEPAIIVLDEGDDLPGITGTHMTSSMAIGRLPDVGRLLDEKYRKAIDHGIPLFGIYIRKEGTR